MHSVPRPSVGIAGAELLEMSYLIENLLFRELIIMLKVASVFQFQLEQLELSHQSGRLRAGLALLYKAC